MNKIYRKLSSRYKHGDIVVYLWESDTRRLQITLRCSLSYPYINSWKALSKILAVSKQYDTLCWSFEETRDSFRLTSIISSFYYCSEICYWSRSFASLLTLSSQHCWRVVSSIQVLQFNSQYWHSDLRHSFLFIGWWVFTATCSLIFIYCARQFKWSSREFSVVQQNYI